MKMYVFTPYDNSWKVSYLTNGVGTNDRLFINEIKSEKDGVVTTGLIAEAKALGMPHDYLETTVTALKAKATALKIGLTVFEDRQNPTSLVTALNPVGSMLTFDFLDTPNAALSADVTGVIDEEAGTIDAEVPFGTTVTALIATFTQSTGATVKIGLTAQASGTTPNNFTSPKTYVVTSETGTTKSYVVTVTVAAE